MRFLFALVFIFSATDYSYAQLLDLSGGQQRNPSSSGTGEYQFQYKQQAPTQNSTWNPSTSNYDCPAGYTLNAALTCVKGGGSGDQAVWQSSKDGKTETGSQSCGDAVTKAQKMCKGAEYSQYSQMALQLVNTFKQLKSQGNYQQACEAAKKVATLGGITNGAVAGMCATAVASCKKACKDDSTDECEELDKYSKLATAQTVENATAFVGSSACANATAGKCLGDAAYNDEDCTQFCLKPGRQDHPKCKLAVNNCSDATFAAANVQYCTCINNPFAANCSTLTGTDPVPGSTPSASDLDLSGDSLGSSAYDFDGATGKGNPATVNTPSAGSGGFDGGGSGSYGFGGNENSGTGDEPLNKDILSGTGSGSAVGAVYGGGGYNEGGGQAKSGRSGDGSGSGLDLRAFLPGGKKDPTRNPASAGYIDPTITAANGLTNFQKVTRKMNEKRPELMP